MNNNEKYIVDQVKEITSAEIVEVVDSSLYKAEVQIERKVYKVKFDGKLKILVIEDENEGVILYDQKGIEWDKELAGVF